MILPSKYVELKDSFIIQATVFLKILGYNEYTFDTLWKEYLKKYRDNQISYAYYIYLIEFMYISGMIDYKENGVIFNENLKH